jgi:hypothetical protein
VFQNENHKGKAIQFGLVGADWACGGSCIGPGIIRNICISAAVFFAAPRKCIRELSSFTFTISESPPEKKKVAIFEGAIEKGAILDHECLLGETFIPVDFHDEILPVTARL